MARQFSELPGLPFDDAVKQILGAPCFICGPIAHVLRKARHDIPKKAEAEQAHVIYWLLGIYKEHGDAWEAHANRLLDDITQKTSRSET